MHQPLLTDADVAAAIDPADAVGAMEDAFAEHAAGTLEAPPRWAIEPGAGSLVFTVGAATGPADTAGFRVYRKDRPSASGLDPEGEGRKLR